MTLVVERWSNGRPVGGTEAPWGRVDYALGQLDSALFPVLDRVDEYDDLTVVGDDLVELAKECREFGSLHPGKVKTLLDRIAALCDEALADPTGKLEFVGD